MRACVAAMLVMQRVQDVQGLTHWTILRQLPTDNAAGNVSDSTSRHLEPLRQTPSELDRFELTPHAGRQAASPTAVYASSVCSSQAEVNFITLWYFQWFLLTWLTCFWQEISAAQHWSTRTVMCCQEAGGSALAELVRTSDRHRWRACILSDGPADSSQRSIFVRSSEGKKQGDLKIYMKRNNWDRLVWIRTSAGPHGGSRSVKSNSRNAIRASQIWPEELHV